MRIEQFLIGMLMFGLVLFVGFSMFATHIVEYDVQGANADSLGRVSNQLDPVMSETQAFEDKLRGDGVSDTDTENSLFAGGFTAASNIWNSIGIMTNLSSVIVEEANIGDDRDSKLIPRILATLMLMLGVLLVVAILYLVFRFKPN